jgi:hypothetical protein
LPFNDSESFQIVITVLAISAAYDLVCADAEIVVRTINRNINTVLFILFFVTKASTSISFSFREGAVLYKKSKTNIFHFTFYLLSAIALRPCALASLP